MRIPKALSYSSLTLLESDPEEFYVKHLAKARPVRQPQTPPMAVGSAFDAWAKAELHKALFGEGADPLYEFGAIFESQVEKQNWDFGLKAGKHVFEAYCHCGAYDALLKELQESIEPPKFEFRIERSIGGVPFLGKPDCRFVLDRGEGHIHCIYDWKVKGYCSKYGASPSKGYGVCLDCFTADKPSRSHGKEHKLYLAKQFRGMTINAGYIETCSTSYADQLCLYGWLLDETPGDESVVLGIEELVSKFMGEDTPPRIRYACHRGLCKKDYQLALLKRVQDAWTRITSDHFFTDLSQQDNDDRCQVLEDMSSGLACGVGDETGEWFNEVTSETQWGKK